jgi:hypothetical protein
MALTQIADVVVPEVFGPYVANLSKTTSALIQSGAVAMDADLSAKLAAGGTTFNMPSWAAPDEEGEYDLPTDDSTEITPLKSTAISEIAVRLMGNKAYSSAVLSAQLAGSDPHVALASHVAGLINGHRQTALVNQLNGLFGTALAGSETDIASESIAGQSATTTFNSDTFVDALAPYGDMMSEGDIIICHSDIKRKMLKEGLIDFVSVGDQDLRMPLYLGSPVIVDDRCDKVAGATDGFKYTSYVMKPGAIRMGDAFGGVAVDMNELAGTGSGVETLIVRDNYSFHVNGTKWQGTPAGATPTAAELATAGNWAKVLDTKNIPVARLISN